MTEPVIVEVDLLLGVKTRPVWIKYCFSHYTNHLKIIGNITNYQRKSSHGSITKNLPKFSKRRNFQLVWWPMMTVKAVTMWTCKQSILITAWKCWPSCRPFLTEIRCSINAKSSVDIYLPSSSWQVYSIWIYGDRNVKRRRDADKVKELRVF